MRSLNLVDPISGGADRPESSASAGGAYVNQLDGEGEERTREAYGEATWQRLVAIKRRFDPGNLFRMNQNIRPD